MTAYRRPLPRRSPLELAAIAVCRNVYAGGCSCELSHSPSVCAQMQIAAVEAIKTVASAPPWDEEGDRT